MKYPLFLLVSLVVGQSMIAQSQLEDRLMSRFGLMYEVLSLKTETIPPRDVAYIQVSLHLGTYYVLTQSGDFVSLGVDPAVQFGFTLSNGRTGYLLQIPMFMKGRIGALATPYNNQRIGLGMGIGMVYSYINYNYNFSNSPTNQQFRQGFLNPSIAFEININSGTGPIHVLAHFSLARPKHEAYFENSAQFQEARYNLWGLGLVYSI